MKRNVFRVFGSLPCVPWLQWISMLWRDTILVRIYGAKVGGLKVDMALWRR